MNLWSGLIFPLELSSSVVIYMAIYDLEIKLVHLICKFLVDLNKVGVDSGVLDTN